MENNNLPSSLEEDKGLSKKLKKFISFFICIVFIFINILFFATSNCAYGYEYINSLSNEQSTEGRDIINNILDTLKSEGYYIVS